MTSEPVREAGNVVVLVPLYNDWESFSELILRLDSVMDRQARPVEVFVVDDASTLEPAPGAFGGPFRAVRGIEVLVLLRNLGHQRAIAVGLAYLACERPDCRAVVVMDADGEDAPEDVPRLLERLEQEGGRKIVFAERTKRSESLFFRAFYALFKLVHVILIGHRVRVGNFSAIPRSRLESLAVVSELWNHYAAAAVCSKQPWCSVPTHRAKRIKGRSTMNFVGLVTHGLSAMSVYGDVVGVRLLVATAVLAALSLVSLVVTVAIRLLTELAIPGWATTTSGLLLVVLLLSILLTATFSLYVLSNRQGFTFLPKRDYRYFVGEVRTLAR